MSAYHIESRKGSMAEGIAPHHQPSQSRSSLNSIQQIRPLSPELERELRRSCIALLRAPATPSRLEPNPYSLLEAAAQERKASLAIPIQSSSSDRTTSNPRSPSITMVHHRPSISRPSTSASRQRQFSSPLIQSTSSENSDAVVHRSKSVDFRRPSTSDPSSIPPMPTIVPPVPQITRRTPPPAPPRIDTTNLDSPTTSPSASGSEASSPEDSPITSPSITNFPTNHRASSIPVMIARPTLITVRPVSTLASPVKPLRPKTASEASPVSTKSAMWAKEFEKRAGGVTSPQSVTSDGSGGKHLSLFPRPRTACGETPIEKEREPMPTGRRVVDTKAVTFHGEVKEEAKKKKGFTWGKLGSVFGLRKKSGSDPKAPSLAVTAA